MYSWINCCRQLFQHELYFNKTQSTQEIYNCNHPIAGIYSLKCRMGLFNKTHCRKCLCYPISAPPILRRENKGVKNQIYYLKGRGEQCFQVCLYFAVSPVNPLCRCWSGATWLAEETLGRNLRGFLRPKHPLQIIPGLQGDSCNNETKGITTDAGRTYIWTSLRVQELYAAVLFVSDHLQQ